MTMALAAALMPVCGYAMKATELRCEFLDSGACVHTQLPPRLSWVPDAGGRRGAAQSAYRIIVASTPEALAKGRADIWDSGKVPSAATLNVEYGGRELKSYDRCYWKVMLWDEKGKADGWSRPSMWRMGVLDRAGWNGAQWIALKDADRWQREWTAHKETEAITAKPEFPMRNYKDLSLWEVYDTIRSAYDASPLLRKRFEAGNKVKAATLYICGLGYFEAFINGRRVGDDVLNPAWTVYDKNPLYCAYDVTDLVHAGDNAIGVMLGRGQYNPICNDAWGQSKSSWVSQPKMIALLRLEDAAGKVTTVVSDGSWHASEGPVIFDDTRIGEIYDARREQDGWTSAAFDDRAWDNANVVAGNTAALTAQMIPPIHRMQPYEPVKRIVRDGGISLFDVGQNIAGWARVKVKGPRGARVLVEYCEMPTEPELVSNLHPARFELSSRVPDKQFASFHDATTEVRQQNAYILRGDEAGEEFECHFSYKGFQYVRVTADRGVEVTGLQGVPVHSDLRSVGEFSCSDPTLNRLQQISRITLLNNMMGLPTDCPHREKQGWTADGYFTTEAAIYNFDMAQFYAKWMRDLRNTQTAGGALSTVAPSGDYSRGESLTWPIAILNVPANLYDYYADRRLIAELYGPMKAFAEHARSHEVPGRPGYVSEVLGDWVSPAADSILPTLRGSSLMAPPEGVIYYGSASYYGILRQMERMAGIVGDSDATPAYYSQWAARVKDNFNTAFFADSEAAYYGDRPTPYRIGPNIVALHEGLVPDSLAGRVERRFRDYLAGSGYKMNTGFLGTRAMMKWLPEVDADAAYRAASQPAFPGWGYMVANGANTMWEDWAGCASVDHLPYCLISEYFYKHLAGIKLSHDAAGRPHIEISPAIPAGLDHAGADYRSIYGTISSHWHRDGDNVVLSVTIPANCTATVTLPGKTVSVDSGRYTFRM